MFALVTGLSVLPNLDGLEYHRDDSENYFRFHLTSLFSIRCASLTRTTINKNDTALRVNWVNKLSVSVYIARRIIM